MNDVIAVLEDQDTATVVVLAEALASLLDADVKRVRMPGKGDPALADAVDVLLAEPDPAAVVLTARAREPLCWEVMERASCPVVVVPRHHTQVRTSISHVLVPLDGRRETALSVAPLVRRFLGAGVQVRVLHVFDETTVPAFWDQAAHSHEHWTEEFLLRNLPDAANLELRRGHTAEQVLVEERREGLDLIMIAWSQRLTEGRARTVREAITDGIAPVLLVPAGPPSP